MKTSKFFLSTLVAAAAMTSTAYAATVIDSNTTITTAFDPEYDLYEGAWLNRDAVWNLSGVTFNIVPQEDTTKFAWIYSGKDSSGRNTDQTLDGLTLKGSGDFGVAFTTGWSQTNTVTLTGMTASGFTGRILVINDYGRPTKTSLSGVELRNAEYMFGSVTIGNSATYGFDTTFQADSAYILDLTGDTSLAGITGSTGESYYDGTTTIGKHSTRERITAAAGTTLTLTGGDANYTGYSNEGAFVYNGAFGTSTTAIGLNVTGGNHTFGGTSYLGSVSVSNGTLKLGGTVTLNETISVTDGTLEFLDGVVVKIGEIIDLTDAIIPTDSNGYATGGVKIYELSSGTVSGSLDSVTDANGHEYSVEDGVASVTDYRTYYVNTGTVNYSDIPSNTTLSSVVVGTGGKFTSTETISNISLNSNGSVDVYRLNASSGTTNLIGTGITIGASTDISNGNPSRLSVSGQGILNIGDGMTTTTVSVGELFTSDSDVNHENTLNIKANATLNITGKSNVADDSRGSSVLLGHWEGNSVVNVDGTLTSGDATIYMGFTSGKKASVIINDGGTINAHGIGRTTWYNPGSAEILMNVGGTLNLGDDGILANTSVTLAGGTLGAFDNWSTSNGMALNGAVTVNTDHYDIATAKTTNSSSHTITLGGALSGEGSLTKTGAGTLALNGENTYSGGTTLNGGVVSVGNNAAFGTWTTTENETTTTHYGAVTVSGASTIDAGVTGLTLANNIAMNAATTVSVGTDESLTLSGVLSGTGKLTVTGGGTLTLFGDDGSTANYYTGGTEINGATVRVKSLGWGGNQTYAKGDIGGDFAHTLLTLSNDAVLEVTQAQNSSDDNDYGNGGAGRGFSVVEGKGTYRYSGSGTSYIRENTSDNATNRFIGLADETTLIFDVVQEGVRLEVSKTIASNELGAPTADAEGAALEKVGDGTLLLSGVNLYTGGTTISKGTLIATNANALGTGDVTVSGGQLSLSGDPSVELTNAINIVLTKGLYANAAAITGTGALDGAKIVVSAADQSALETLVQQGSYKLWDSNIAVSSDSEVTYSFEGLEGYTYNVEGGILTFAPIPEPSAFGLLAGVGALALVAARRRRRK